MAVKNNPAIGHVACEFCEARASVHQQQNKNAFFYTRFCDCKKPGATTLQNEIKGDSHQQYIFDNIELIPGMEVREPPHIARNKPVITQAKEWSPNMMKKPQTEPQTEPETEPQPAAVSTAKKGGNGLLYSVLGVLAVAGVSLIAAGVSS